MTKIDVWKLLPIKGAGMRIKLLDSRSFCQGGIDDSFNVLGLLGQPWGTGVSCFDSSSRATLSLIMIKVVRESETIAIDK